ncbi:MAG TPA: adenylate/guanylate cyclase domain-containing protein [Steroidobacteraceae bacterium]|nr:adenylate/guanylate cyclase domain-containing protein [Steroidobacteraceae bacterium]
MRHAVGSRAVADVISEIEIACGSPIPVARRQAVTQKVSQMLADVDSRRPIEHKQVSILLSDLRGFTAMTERRSAADVIGILNRYFSRMCEVIFRYQGTVDKFMGDGIMVLFGAPDTGRDDLIRAIACATEMQRMMNEVNEENRELGMPQLFMGIGINTGEVVAANVGSDLHREYTVIGDHVNLASRIEAHSLRGQVLLSEHSYQLAKDYIEIGDVKEVQVKGKREPVKLYELKSTMLPEPMEVPTREVRKSPRILTDMPLLFQVVDEKHVLPDLYCGQILDISYSGMLVKLKSQIPLNTEIKFSIALSLLSPEVTEIYARILRSHAVESDYECSIEFTSIDDAGQRAVRQFVDLSVA